MLRAVRSFFRDVFLHFGPAVLCLFRRHHRKLIEVGRIGKNGFRSVPLFQCTKCHQFTVKTEDAKRWSGK